MKDEQEYIYYRKNGKLLRFPKKDNTTLFRGLTQKYDPNYDKSKLDNQNGYESWTDSYDLAKEYAGENGYVYSTEVSNKDLNTEDIFDENGDRSLVYWNDKPVALHGVEGEEFMLYTDHDDHDKLEYKEISSPSNSEDKIETRDKETSTDMSDLDEAFTVQEQTGNKVFLNGKEIKQDKDNKRKQNAEMKKEENKFKTNYLSDKLDEDEFHDKFWEMSDQSYDKLSPEDRKIINSDYVGNEESTWINSTVREHGNDNLSDKRKEQVDALDRATHTYKHDEDLTVKRFDQGDMLTNVYKIDTSLDREEIANEMKKHIGEIRDEKGFISASLDEAGNGYWDNLLVHSEINIPKGSDMYVTENLRESEIILPRNSKLELKDVEFKESTIPGMEKEYGHVILKYQLIKEDKEEKGISNERVIQLKDSLYGANMNRLKEIAKEIAPNWNLDKYSSDNVKDKQQLYMMLLKKLNQMKK